MEAGSEPLRNIASSEYNGSSDDEDTWDTVIDATGQEEEAGPANTANKIIEITLKAVEQPDSKKKTRSFK
jgi:hypothetical protein